MGQGYACWPVNTVFCPVNGIMAEPPQGGHKVNGSTPSVYVVHGALIATQVIFGGGSVVGKLGVDKFNPILFALIREVCAGTLLLGWAVYADGAQRLRRRRDAVLFAACGLFIFANQACFIIGDKLAGPVLASAWQPTQPVFTLVISLLLGWEAVSVGKVLGILMSFAGATIMVTVGQDFSAGEALVLIAGNVFLFLNCLGTSLYVLTAKLVLARGYPPSTVTAWSYLCGSLMMACVASAVNSSCTMVALLCPPSDGAQPFHCDSRQTSCEAWAVPASAIGPLAYWIVLNSCAAYWLMTWANKHVAAGFVLAYCALQPLTSTLLSVAIVASGAETSLTMPGLNALGGIPILLGLALILRDGKRAHGGANQHAILSPHRDPLLEQPSTDSVGSGHGSSEATSFGTRSLPPATSAPAALSEPTPGAPHRSGPAV